MEKLNLNFSGGSNIVKSICWIMSYLSWIMLLITGWISLKWLEEKPGIYGIDDIKIGNIIWTIRPYRTDPVYGNLMGSGSGKYYPYMPFQMHVALIYIVFILSLIIILGGCIVFFIKTIFKPDDQVKNGMMGEFSKFHFFPLLCTSALFIIGECVDNVTFDANYYKNLEDHLDSMTYAGLVFSILALASFIFIYIMTDLNTNDWWVLLLLKKGTYSCLIVLTWYYFCYNIYYVHNRSVENETPEKQIDWAKGCGLAFSIIFGIGSLAFSFIFKDLVACGMNLLIYVGLTAFYFKIHKDIRKLENCNKNGDGIVDIIMMVASVALLVFLLLVKREECLKS